MLHITNGDSVICSFREGEVSGEYLGWYDPLHDGPVPLKASLEELSDVRAQALAVFGGGSYQEFRSSFAARDRSLAAFRSHEEVVLWFEHDLYDQLQLIQLLDWFSRQDLAGVKLSLIQINSHPQIQPFYGLGQLDGRQLRELLPARQSVSERQLFIGRQAWQAFCSPDPSVQASFAHYDFSEMPFLGDSLRRFLEEYPSTKDGLSRSQRQILHAAAAGKHKKWELYKESQKLEACPWGDGSVYMRMETLASGFLPALDRTTEHDYLMNDQGRLILSGGADWVRSQNGIDVWLGGVHLSGPEALWRWSEATRACGKLVNRF